MSTEQDRYAMPGSPPTDEDLRHEAELTRDELGDTVAALMHKVDVKSRMREAAQRKLTLLHDAANTAAQQARGLIQPVRRHPVVAGAGAIAVLAVIVLAAVHRD